jgi:hypothetical protein
MTPSLHKLRRRLKDSAKTVVTSSSTLDRVYRKVRNKPEPFPPVRQITRGPKFHWFGYYDKFESDPADRFVLGMEIDFEHSAPRPDDTIKVGMIDLCDQDRWKELGSSSAWCWQQGCMLQWRPGSESEVIWNDREDGRYVSRILNVKTGNRRTIPHPVYALSPDGRWAITPDFRRLGDTRPGYGYVGIPDPNRDVLAPTDSGIFKIDLGTGKQELLFSVADVAALPYPHGDISKAKHWFNHLLFNPDGSRFVFLHRWRKPGDKWHTTRMVTAAADGSDIRIPADSGWISHFIWHDPEHILAYAEATPRGRQGFYIFKDSRRQKVEEIAKGVVTSDGHCTYSPDGQWVLYDTYPDKNMIQHVYLFDLKRNRRVHVGAFEAPKPYWGAPPQNEWRCDLHPRFTRNGKNIIIDSPYNGTGRQIHLIDVSSIVA